MQAPADSYLFLEHLYLEALTQAPARLPAEYLDNRMDRCLERLDHGDALAGPEYRELWGYAHAG